MARRVDSKGDSLTGYRHRSTTDRNGANVDGDPRQNALMEILTRPQDMSEVMAFFCDHGGGYLKVRRSDPGADLHLAWTWSNGPHAGKYVYARVEYWRLLFGLELLQRKVLEVEQLVRKASPDKYGGGQ